MYLIREFLQKNRKNGHKVVSIHCTMGSDPVIKYFFSHYYGRTEDPEIFRSININMSIRN